MDGTAPGTAGATRDLVPAPLLVIAAVASVQSGSAIATTLFDAAGAPGVVLLRIAFSALLLGVALRPRFWSWPRASLRAAAMLGVTMAAMNLCFYQAIRTVPLGIAVTVEFLGPLTVALVQTRRWRDLLWAMLAGTGVALLGLSGGTTAPWSGLAWAALAGAFWAGYILASARVGQLVPGTGGLAVALLFGTLVILPIGLPGVAAVLDQPAILVGGLVVAVLSSLLPYGLELHALRRLPTRVFGILMSLQPAAGALAGLVLIGQLLAVREIVALVLVSIASAGATRRRALPMTSPETGVASERATARTGPAPTGREPTSGGVVRDDRREDGTR